MMLVLFTHNSPELALQVISFLSGTDTLRLHCVSTCCNGFLSQHSNAAFGIHLEADFPEGQLIAQAFEWRPTSSKTSYKEMYLAFLNRWKIPRTSNIDTGAGSEQHIAIPWSHPRPSEHVKNEDDLKALHFIFRIWDTTDSCGFMGWEQIGSGDHTTDFDELLSVFFLDYCPPLSSTVCRWIDSFPDEFDREKFNDITRNILSTYRLTLHAVDIETCQVMTLLDESSGKWVEGWGGESFTIFDHCCDFPKLYGVPGRGSPFYRSLPNDFDLYDPIFDGYDPIFDGDDTIFDGYENIETLELQSALGLGRSFEHNGDERRPEGYDDRVHLEEVTIGPSELSTIRDRHSLCSFFRALMKVHCVEMPVRNEKQLMLCKSIEGVAPQMQPAWTNVKKILGNILSFIPFEQQVTKLRIVCKSFKASALGQLECKMLKTSSPIAFQRYDACSWFRADARRGWSEGFNSLESIIDDALWMVSCRCLNSCKNKGSCPGMEDAPSFGSGGVTKKLDMVAARRLLSERGEFYLTPDFPDGQKKRRRGGPHVKASFHCDTGKSLYQLCETVHKNIKEEAQYHYLPSNLARHYGVTVEMTAKRFLRSLFLVFTDGTSADEGHFPEISVSTAKTSIQNYRRTKVMFRFRTASHEPMEICLESQHAIL